MRPSTAVVHNDCFEVRKSVSAAVPTHTVHASFNTQQLNNSSTNRSPPAAAALQPEEASTRNRAKIHTGNVFVTRDLQDL